MSEALTTDGLAALLARIATLRCGVVGDFALDVYFDYREDTGDVSLETGKTVFHAGQLRASPGAAGNVVMNLLALRPRAAHVFGVVGPDLHGRELRHCLADAGADTAGLVVQPTGWDTQTYVKPHRDATEQNRLDFGCENAVAPASHQAVLAALAAALPALDVLLINQQFRAPLLTPDFAEGLNALLARHPRVVALADCRDAADLLRGVIQKLTTGEVARLLGVEPADPQAEGACRAQLAAAVARMGGPVLLTRSEYGLLVGAPDGAVVAQPGVMILDDTDPVGAGDTCAAAFAACRGAGASWAEAAAVANLAASVTVRKLGQTGTATPAEITAAHAAAEYVYHPDIASDPRQARYRDGTQLEVINEAPSRPLAHVIVDHDGTISVLREGWEAVMFATALDCICGAARATLSRRRLDALEAKVRRLIEQTTGIQTIQQMMRVADLARSEGLRPAADLPDAAACKRVYLAQLMVSVNARIAEFQAGEKDLADFTVKGAPAFLAALAARGLTLYLASGTDQADVRREAELLGYAALFRGGIHGSLGNELGDAKRKVVQRLLRETGAPASSILVVGDGPVELREGRKVGALCLGVASDEVRRHGLNPAKRARLIRAGADIIVPDFAQLPALLAALGLPPA